MYFFVPQVFLYYILFWITDIVGGPIFFLNFGSNIFWVQIFNCFYFWGGVQTFWGSNFFFNFGGPIFLWGGVHFCNFCGIRFLGGSTFFKKIWVQFFILVQNLFKKIGNVQKIFLAVVHFLGHIFFKFWVLHFFVQIFNFLGGQSFFLNFGYNIFWGSNCSFFYFWGDKNIFAGSIFF